MCTRVLGGSGLPRGLVPAPAGSLLSPGLWGALQRLSGVPPGVCAATDTCVSKQM